VKKKSNIPKLLTAIFLFLAYSNVLITQLHCNFSVLLQVSEQPHYHHDKDVHSHEEHDHRDSEKNSDPKGEKCCNEKTSAFFASQINSTNTSVEFNNTFFTGFTGYTNTIVRTALPFNLKEYFSYQFPPPKIPDIQIFTHLFRI
jgi:hypothetical protein